jgi:hypothetical protein
MTCLIKYALDVLLPCISLLGEQVLQEILV